MFHTGIVLLVATVIHETSIAVQNLLALRGHAAWKSRASEEVPRVFLLTPGSFYGQFKVPTSVVTNWFVPRK